MRLCEPLFPESASALTSEAPFARIADDEVRVNSDWRIEAVGRSVARKMQAPNRPPYELEGRRFWEFMPRLVGTPAETKLRDALRQRASVKVEWWGTGRAPLEFIGRPADRCWQFQVREIAPDSAPPEKPASSPAPLEAAPSDAALESALSLNPIPAYVCTALGRFAFANQPAARFLGWSSADLRGRTFLDLLLPAPIAASLHQAIQRAILTGESERITLGHPQPDGTTVRYEHCFAPQQSPHGAVLRVMGTAHPLADPATSADTPGAERLRHQVLIETATSLLRESDRRAPLPKLLRRLAGAIGAEIHLLHTLAPGKRLTFEAAGGLDHEQLADAASPGFGEGLSGIAAQEDWPIVLDEVPQRSEPAAAEPRKWGARAAVCHPLRSGGRLLGTVVFATTTRQQFSRGELAFIRDAADLLGGALEIRRAFDEAQKARVAAVADLRIKDEFIAAVSHELRTPLNPALLIASHAASNFELPPIVRCDFDAIASSIRMEVRLIDDLLDLTRFAHGKLSLERKLVNLHTALMAALTTIAAEIEQKRIELCLELAPQSPTVDADPLRLQQAFWNLLKNAVKFTPAGGVVSVRTRLISPNQVRIEIMDTGVGLTADEIARAFEAFAQGEHARNGTSPFGGLGLGLSIAQKIVALHSGRIHATSEGRDRGACFVVELPTAASNDSPASAASCTEAPPDSPVARAPARLRILLVEDHRATREALLRLLVQRDYEVIAAGSVSEARHIALKKEFDLVISDIGLPDLTGYELMAGLRSDYNLAGIALTGHGTDQDIAQARAAGFVAHIVKPITIQALESALANAVASSHAAKG